MSDLIYSDILIKYMHAQASNYEDILQISGYKESHFQSLPLRQAEGSIILAQTSFQRVPKTFWCAEMTSQFFCNLNSPKTFTCLSGKLRTEFTHLIAKSTSPKAALEHYFLSTLDINYSPSDVPRILKGTYTTFCNFVFAWNRSRVSQDVAVQNRQYILF